jgi:hypothetical protein
MQSVGGHAVSYPMKALKGLLAMQDSPDSRLPLITLVGCGQQAAVGHLCCICYTSLQLQRGCLGGRHHLVCHGCWQVDHDGAQAGCCSLECALGQGAEGLMDNQQVDLQHAVRTANTQQQVALSRLQSYTY